MDHQIDLNILSGSYSILGDRMSQQDSFREEWTDQGLFFASVCDGMGGLQGGERASATGIEVIFHHIGEYTSQSAAEGEPWIRKVLTEADEQVTGLRNEAGNPLGAGSTCVLTVADKQQFLWGCVGDSRIYYYHEQKLYTLTRMHNYDLQLNQMLQNGEINRNQYAEMSSKGEALISFLGIGGLPLLDVAANAILWAKGDWLVLCSDGLYKSLNDMQIAAILEESGENPHLAAKRLCLEADRLGTRKQDNTTVIAIFAGDKEDDQMYGVHAGVSGA